MSHVFNKILVCTDFSTQSMQALIAAEKLRTLTGGEIILLHVCFGFPDEDGSFLWSKPRNEEIFAMNGDQAKEKMKEQVKQAQIKDVNYLIKFGNTAETIVDVMEGEQFDILFMGHGGKGRFQGLLGSVARKVITASDLPIMVVKKEFFNYKVAALIDETNVSPDVINLAFDFFRTSKAQEIQFISMSDDKSLSDKLKSEIAKFAYLEENPIIRIEHPMAYDMVPELVGILTNSQVDVAVVKRSNKNKRRRLFLGSTTMKLLDAFPGNLLICPEAD